MKKILIVDGQLLQTNAFYRGMGGYTYNLISHFMVQRPDVRVLVILNQQLECGQERLDALQAMMPGAELHQLSLPFQPKPQTGEEERAVAALDAFIAAEAPLDSHEVTYFIPALFLFDYCAVFPSGVRKTLLFHDLTPLIFRDDLAKYFPAHLYFPRFKTIFEADIVFTNSATTGDDLQLYLGFDPARLVTIDGSLNAHVHAAPKEAAHDPTTILRRLGLHGKDYLLMPTGGTEFKNNVRAVQAFARLKEALTTDLKIVLTSFFRDYEKDELRFVGEEDVVFTGNVDGDELAALFEGAKAVVLPSLYEGLGLPVLEGIAHNKPVACSDIAVFREIPHFKEALYVFDPRDVESITEAMLRAAAAAGFEQKRTYYSTILEKYNWDRSAKLFAEALGQPERFDPRPAAKKRVAILCPDPRKNKDVGVFAQRMYGYGLQAGIELVYFIDPGGPDDPTETVLPDYIRSLALVYDIAAVYEKLPELRPSATLHFLANDKRFAKLLRAQLSLPGYTYIGNEGYQAVIEEMAVQGMLSSSQQEAEARLGEAAKRLGGFETPSVLAQAKGVIVERHARRSLEKTLKGFGLHMPLLEVPECEMVNFGPHALGMQKDIYGQLFTFIERKK